MIIVHSSLHATSSVASWSGQSAQQRQHPVMASSVETNVTDLIVRLASRSQIKHRYRSHRQQPQNDSRSDVLDPFLVVKEPSMMHAIHGQHSYRPDPTEYIITSTGRCIWPASPPIEKPLWDSSRRLAPAGHPHDNAALLAYLSPHRA